jgi:capsular polysaccharide biosynthesis protein
LTLKAFAAAVRRYRLTYLIVAAVVFALGLTAVLLAPVKYVSTTRLMVSVEGSTTAAAYQNEEVATRRVRSYIPLITSGVVSQRVIDKLGLPVTPSQLADKITVANVPPKTPLIDIEVTDDSPSRARQITETVAGEFIAYAASIETPTGEDSQKVHTRVVSDAGEGREDPLKPVFLGVLAALAALLLGAVAVWIRAVRERDVPATDDAAAQQEEEQEEEATAEPQAAPSDEDSTHEERVPIETNGSAPTTSTEATDDPVEATQHS